MDIMQVIRDEQELDRLFVQEGRTKMNFVKIGKYVINLDNVTEMHAATDTGRITISFAGADDNYISIRKADDPDAFAQLMTWMDEQPALLGEEIRS